MLSRGQGEGGKNLGAWSRSSSQAGSPSAPREGGGGGAPTGARCSAQQGQQMKQALWERVLAQLGELQNGPRARGGRDRAATGAHVQGHRTPDPGGISLPSSSFEGLPSWPALALQGLAGCEVSSPFSKGLKSVIH